MEYNFWQFGCMVWFASTIGKMVRFISVRGYHIYKRRMGGQCGMEWQQCQSICSGMIYWPCFLSSSLYQSQHDGQVAIEDPMDQRCYELDSEVAMNVTLCLFFKTIFPLHIGFEAPSFTQVPLQPSYVDLTLHMLPAVLLRFKGHYTCAELPVLSW